MVPILPSYSQTISPRTKGHGTAPYAGAAQHIREKNNGPALGSLRTGLGPYQQRTFSRLRQPVTQYFSYAGDTYGGYNQAGYTVSVPAGAVRLSVQIVGSSTTTGAAVANGLCYYTTVLNLPVRDADNIVVYAGTGNYQASTVTYCPTCNVCVVTGTYTVSAGDTSVMINNKTVAIVTPTGVTRGGQYAAPSSAKYAANRYSDDYIAKNGLGLTGNNNAIIALIFT